MSEWKQIVTCNLEIDLTLLTIGNNTLIKDLQEDHRNVLRNLSVPHSPETGARLTQLMCLLQFIEQNDSYNVLFSSRT